MKLKQIVPQIALTALLIGCGSGIVAGAIGGASLATERDREDSVSRSQYQQAVTEADKMAMLYYAERKRYVQLTQKHSVATRIFEKAPGPKDYGYSIPIHVEPTGRAAR